MKKKKKKRFSVHHYGLIKVDFALMAHVLVCLMIDLNAFSHDL